MKTISKIIPVIALIFILAPRFVHAREEKTKVIKKEYTINPNAQVSFENKFGQIHCNNWDKNIVSVEVRINVAASSEEKVNRLFAQVNIENEGSATNVQFRTIYDKEGFSGSSRITVDYTVYLPVTVDLSLTNKFGDIFLNELSGTGNFDIAYGNMEINKLSNSKNVINIKFGKGDIKYITGAVVSLKYSEMELEYAGSLFMDSKFSNLDAKKIVSMNMGFEGGKLDIINCSVITGTSKFTDLSFTHLDKTIDMDIQYGNCDVDFLDADFSLVSVRNKYGNVSINIPKGTSYSLEADLKFCDLDFPENDANLTQRISTNTSKSFKGTVGKKSNPEAKVIVKSEFGNVSLE
jgi:hypothetical protein